MIEASLLDLIVKQLPPSASTLHLIDVNGALGENLSERRADLEVTIGLAADENSIDAIVAYGETLGDDLLALALKALRPGGRLIVIDARSEPSAKLVKLLENAGYTRILVEELTDTEGGVLMRGEKPHLTDNTLARVQSVAEKDSALSEFKGRYLHLLIRQTPNKPVWALKPDDHIEWQALALAKEDNEDQPLIAFSSLPNAVAFMQQAVIAGSIKDVNKVAKFSRESAHDWHLLINPALDILQDTRTIFVSIDPASAEAPDE